MKEIYISLVCDLMEADIGASGSGAKRPLSFSCLLDTMSHLGDFGSEFQASLGVWESDPQ